MIRRAFLKRMAMAAVASGLLGSELFARKPVVPTTGGGAMTVALPGDFTLLEMRWVAEHIGSEAELVGVYDYGDGWSRAVVRGEAGTLSWFRRPTEDRVSAELKTMQFEEASGPFWISLDHHHGLHRHG